VEAEAFAKLNLSLRVLPRDRSGLHPLRSLMQSISWADLLTLESADEDAFTVRGLPVPDDESNLAWRALGAARRASARPAPAALALDKRIPVSAGLGGGSADAAAVLGMAAAPYGLARAERDALAPALGADVPFCLVGGTCLVEEHGERLTGLSPLEGFALAVVVPPFEVLTVDAFGRWDDLGGPEGLPVPAGDLPVPLRDGPPPVNDLLPAAVSLVPELGDWLAELRRAWGQAAFMSGSGPALFGFFASAAEAAEAATAVRGFRAARACRPVRQGWQMPSGTLP
jgi:4-diphosphocytidyl-2-C-methyl-D-erythritol kinase